MVTHIRTLTLTCVRSYSIARLFNIEVPQDTIRLKLFPFSLDGAAREWYHTLEPDDTANWPGLVMKFLNKFFPESKVVEYRHKISGFSMKDGESLYYAWERFKLLLKRCPQHGFRADEQVRIFYGGVSQYWKLILDAAAGSHLLSKVPNEAMRIVESMAINRANVNADKTRQTAEAVMAIKDGASAMDEKISEINKQIADLRMAQNAQYFGMQMPQLNSAEYLVEASAGENQNIAPTTESCNYFAQYGNKNHPGFSYNNPNAALNPPQTQQPNQGRYNQGYPPRAPYPH